MAPNLPLPTVHHPIFAGHRTRVWRDQRFCANFFCGIWSACARMVMFFVKGQKQETWMVVHDEIDQLQM